MCAAGTESMCPCVHMWGVQVELRGLSQRGGFPSYSSTHGAALVRLVRDCAVQQVGHRLDAARANRPRLISDPNRPDGYR